MVPRWGVLGSTRSLLSNRYSGDVFVRMRASGHMFVQHYMNPIFSNQDRPVSRQASGFFDQVVNVDEATVNRREAAALEDLSVKRRESGLQFGSGERIEDGGESGAEVLSFDRTKSGTLMVEEAKGKTVGELSRLWKYQGGKSPK